MKKNRFEFVCQESQAGMDAFVTHPNTHEEGRVLNCSSTHLTVQTSAGKERCWDYHECEELKRTKEEWPRR